VAGALLVDRRVDVLLLSTRGGLEAVILALLDRLEDRLRDSLLSSGLGGSLNRVASLWVHGRFQDGSRGVQISTLNCLSATVLNELLEGVGNSPRICLLTSLLGSLLANVLAPMVERLLSCLDHWRLGNLLIEDLIRVRKMRLAMVYRRDTSERRVGWLGHHIVIGRYVLSILVDSSGGSGKLVLATLIVCHIFLPALQMVENLDPSEAAPGESVFD
jgi:hypothetical protein